MVIAKKDYIDVDGIEMKYEDYFDTFDEDSINISNYRDLFKEEDLEGIEDWDNTVVLFLNTEEGIKGVSLNDAISMCIVYYKILEGLSTVEVFDTIMDHKSLIIEYLDELCE